MYKRQTHHHLYQQFSRNLPQVQDMELFDWLKTLYEIWKNLDADVIRPVSYTHLCTQSIGLAAPLRSTI